MPATIDEQIANLREVRVLVAQSLTELDEHLDALAKAKKLLNLNIQVALPQYDGQEHPSRFVPPQAKIMTISQPDVDTSCITHCTSIPESMFAWADANNGKLDGKALATAIRIVGISKAKNVASAAATIHNFAVKAYAKHWEKTGPNKFRRIYEPNEGDAEPPSVIHDEGEEHDPAQTLAAD